MGTNASRQIWTMGHFTGQLTWNLLQVHDRGEGVKKGTEERRLLIYEDPRDIFTKCNAQVLYGTTFEQTQL